MTIATRASYPGDGVTDEFDVPFPYLSRDHVKIYVNGREPIIAPKWVTASRIKLDEAPASTSVVLIKRESPLDLLVDYTADAQVTEDDLDLAYRHAIFVLQEAFDLYDDALRQGLVELDPTLPPIDFSDIDAVIERIIERVLEVNIVDDLRQRITDIDLNAEQIIERTAQIIDVEGRLELTEQLAADATSAADTAFATAEALANFTGGSVLETALIDETNARIEGDTAIAEDISLLGARSGDGTAFILDTSTVEVSPGESMSTRLNALLTSAQNNEAAILTEQTARTTETSALANAMSLLGVETPDGQGFILDDDTVFISTGNGDETVSVANRLTGLATLIDDNTAAILTEQIARADAISAEASRTDTLIAQVTTIAEQNNSGAATFFQATAPDFVTDNVENGDFWYDTDDFNKPHRAVDGVWVAVADPRIEQNTAAIATEVTARTDAMTAETNRVNAELSQLATDIGNNQAAILTEQTTRVTEISALTTQANQLAVIAGDNEAAIDQLNQAVADETSARISQVNNIEAKVEAAGRSFYQSSPPDHVADGVKAGDQWFDTDDFNKAYVSDDSQWVAVSADAGSLRTDLEAQIQDERTVRAAEDEVLADTLKLLGAVQSNASAFLLDESVVKVINPDTGQRMSIGSRLTGIDTKVDNAQAAIAAETTARSDDISAVTAQLNQQIADFRVETDEGLAALVNAEITGVEENVINVVSGDITSIQNDLTAMFNSLSGPDGDVQTFNQALQGMVSDISVIDGEVTTLVTDVSSISTDLGNLNASVDTLSQVVNGVEAQYAVRVNSNGVVTGLQLISDSTTQTSEFRVQAQAFRIYQPNGDSYIEPFTVESGITRVSGALIKDGTIEARHLQVNTLSAISASMGTVTGGLFRTGVNADFRAEIGDNTSVPIWVGQGVKVKSNGVFWVDTDGNGYFGGDLRVGGVTTENLGNNAVSEIKRANGSTWHPSSPTTDTEIVKVTGVNCGPGAVLCGITSICIVDNDNTNLDLRLQYRASGGAWITAKNWYNAVDVDADARQINFPVGLNDAIPITADGTYEFRLIGNGSVGRCRLQDPHIWVISNKR